jgi:integrase
MAEKITKKLVAALVPPASGNRITYDTDIKGFGVRITAKDAIAFILNYRVSSRERRLTIGNYPDWSVTAAREEAKMLKQRTDRGDDPLAKRHHDRQAPTMQDLCSRYIEDYLPRKRSQRDDLREIQKVILPRWKMVKVADISFTDIDRLHRERSKAAPIQANRTVALLSKMFNLAEKWEWRPQNSNPCKGIEKNQEEKRDRFLNGDEILRLSQALDELSNLQSANIIRLCMLTGARRGEVLSAEWSHINLEESIWDKPSSHTKQKRRHRTPLSAPARQLLQAILQQAPKLEDGAPVSEYVFPGKSAADHQTEVKRSWEMVRQKAGLPDVRLHDLRHTFASIVVSSGGSLAIIGALLGHTQTQTTARYAHLFDDPLREAAEHVGAVISTSGRQNMGEVIPISSKNSRT